MSWDNEVCSGCCIICPYCNTVLERDCWEVFENNGDTAHYVCDKCGCEVKGVLTDIEYNYTSTITKLGKEASRKEDE